MKCLYSKIKLLLLLLLFPNFAFSQSEYLSLFDKYGGKQTWLSYHFLFNNPNDELAKYKSVEQLLAQNKGSKIHLKFICQGKIFRVYTIKERYDSTGIIWGKYRGSINLNPFSLLRKLLSGNVFTKTDKSRDSIGKNENGLVTFRRNYYWKENCKYDSIGNLIELEHNYCSDSGVLFCVSLVNKWIGKYNSSNLIVNNTTFFDNGSEFENLTTTFKDGKPIESIGSMRENIKLKKYFYDKNGLLKEIRFLDKKNRVKMKYKYKWTIE